MASNIRALPALFVLTLAACANTGPGTGTLAPPATPPTTITPTSTGADVRIAADRQLVTTVVKGSIADAWNALLEVYDEARIPVTERDMSAGIVGNPRFIVRGRLLGHPLSYFLDCGQGMTGLHANNDRIEMNIRSGVAAAGQGQVRVSVILDAVAHPPEGTSNSRIQCGSTQRLENELLQRVAKQVGGS